MNKRKGPERTLLDFTRLGFRDVVMAGHYCHDRAHPPLKPHLHRNVFEICVLQQGTQTYFVDSQRYDLAGGDVFITKPGEVHGTGPEPENRGRLYWIELRIVSPARPVLGLPAKESRSLLRRLERLPCRHLRHGEILLPTLERIFKTFPDSQNPFRTAELRNLLLRFFLDLIALARHKNAPSPVWGINRALSYIEAHPATAIPVAVLAREAHLSKSFFKKAFKLHAGMAPIEYVMYRRIELAKQKLCSTDIPITRVAMDLGFATSQHFATAFKRLTGKAPRGFRRKPDSAAEREAPKIGAGVCFHPISALRFR